MVECLPVESEIGELRLKRQEILYKFACAFICISAILFFTVFLPAARPFPWSDEWDRDDVLAR